MVNHTFLRRFANTYIHNMERATKIRSPSMKPVEMRAELMLGVRPFSNGAIQIGRSTIIPNGWRNQVPKVATVKTSDPMHMIPHMSSTIPHFERILNLDLPFIV